MKRLCELIDRFRRISVYKSPWVEFHSTIGDMNPNFPFDVSSGESINYHFVLRPEWDTNRASPLRIPHRFDSAMTIHKAADGTWSRKLVVDSIVNSYDFSLVKIIYDSDIRTDNSIAPYILCPQYLIMSDHFPLLVCMIGSVHLCNGIYLARELTNNTSRWITEPYYSYVPVKAPKDADGDYYLNLFKITTDDMVAILNNLKDHSTDGVSRTLTLGSDNLSRLTEEQKEIAYAKGWELA